MIRNGSIYDGSGAAPIADPAGATGLNEALTGKTLAEVARLRGQSPEETALDLVIEDDSRVGAVYFGGFRWPKASSRFLGLDLAVDDQVGDLSLLVFHEADLDAPREREEARLRFGEELEPLAL